MKRRVSIPWDGICLSCGSLIARHFDARHGMVGCAEARKQTLEAATAAAQQPQRDLYIVRQSRQRGAVDDVVPDVLTSRELAERLQMGKSQFHRHRLRRDHPAIKQLDGPGHPRFCGKTFRIWRDGGEAAPARRSYFQRVGR